MSKSGAKRHVHKYFRGPSDTWACGFPDCTHLMPQNMRFMMEGKQSICWLCNDRYILTRANLQQIKPLCNDCWLKVQGLDGDKNLIIEQLIQRKNEEVARLTTLRFDESQVITNEPDSDCMTPNVCVLGKVEIMCDNCREKILYTE